MRGKIYTHALDCEEFGEREDGTEFQRFRVLFPEDVVKSIWKHHGCTEYHDLAIGKKGTCLDAVIEDLELQPEVALLRMSEEIPQRADNDDYVNVKGVR